MLMNSICAATARYSELSHYCWYLNWNIDCSIREYSWTYRATRVLDGTKDDVLLTIELRQG